MKYLILKGLILCSLIPSVINASAKIKHMLPRHTYTFIRVQFNNATPTDSLAIFQSTDQSEALDYLKGDFRFYKSGNNGRGMFTFKLSNKNEFSYIVLGKLRAKTDLNLISNNSDLRFEILPYYLVQRGDHITIKISELKPRPLRNRYMDFSYQFTGKGYLKYKIRYKADSVAYYATDTARLINEDYSYNEYNYENEKIKDGLSILNKYQKSLNHRIYNILQDYIINKIKKEEALLINNQINRDQNKIDSNKKTIFLKTYIDSNIFLPSEHSSLSLKLFSKYYVDAELGKESVISLIKYGENYRDSVYTLLKKNYQGIFLGKIILDYFTTFGFALNRYNELLSDALSTVKSKKYADQLSMFQKSVTGQIAYNFSLPDVLGKKVTLKDFKGRVILIDFWYTGCGNCINFYKNVLSKLEQHFQNFSNVAFLTVSIDKERTFWLKSVNSGIYTSPTVVNLFTAGQGLSHNVIKNFQVESFPCLMIIGKDQILHRVTIADQTYDGLLRLINDTSL